VLQCVAVCCSVLQCVAVCCSVLQCVSWLIKEYAYLFVNMSVCFGQIRSLEMHEISQEISEKFPKSRLDSNCAIRCKNRVAACCSVLQCVAVYYSVLQCIAVCCSVVQCTAATVELTFENFFCQTNTEDEMREVRIYCNTLQHIATHCNTLQYTAAQCNTLQHAATSCNALQHTATHCNTLHRTTTYCNTLKSH